MKDFAREPVEMNLVFIMLVKMMMMMLNFSPLFLFVMVCAFRIAVLFVKFLSRHRQGRGLVHHQSQRGNTTIKTCISLEFYAQSSLPYLFYFQ